MEFRYVYLAERRDRQKRLTQLLGTKSMTSASSSSNTQDFIVRVLKIFFPGHKTWIVKALTFASLAVLVQPFWEPFAEAIVKSYLGVTVPSPPMWIGWTLLVTGVFLYIANLYVDSHFARLSATSSIDEILRLVANSDAKCDWNHVSTGLRSSAVYRHDSNLRFEVSIDDADLQQRDFREAWANKHPDPRATGYYYDLFYGATLVRRFILVGVDGERALLPLPDRMSLKVKLLDYKIAQIHDTIGTLDDYIKRPGLSLGDS